jgi:flagellar biogenesis protein FliO
MLPVAFVFGLDPITFTVLTLILLFIFFVYLLLRRTAQGFKEGMNKNR